MRKKKYTTSRLEVKDRFLSFLGLFGPQRRQVFGKENTSDSIHKRGLVAKNQEPLVISCLFHPTANIF